jgi:hypothetical protein
MRDYGDIGSERRIIRSNHAMLCRYGHNDLGSSATCGGSTDQAAVDAAKLAFDAASTAKDRECGNGDPKQRGRFCRDKEDAEKTAADMLTKATAAKAITDRATRIEADMRPIRDRLRLAGPVQEANVQGNALAKLFRLPDAEAGFFATLQQFGLAAIVELLIVLSMVAFELMGRDARPKLVLEPRAIERSRSPSRSWSRRRSPSSRRSCRPGRVRAWLLPPSNRLEPCSTSCTTAWKSRLVRVWK